MLIHQSVQGNNKKYVILSKGQTFNTKFEFRVQIQNDTTD